VERRQGDGEACAEAFYKDLAQRATCYQHCSQ
jgi:hypothetical protein